MLKAVWLSVAVLILPMSLGVGVAEDYRIRPGDVLLIAVVGNSDYNQSLTVREDGKISYFGGDLQVGGETPEAVRQLVHKILSEHGQLKQPLVMVSPMPREREIFVGGAVKNPNRYPLAFQDEIDLYKAIAWAGGATELADLKRVQVVRQQHGFVDSYNISSGEDYQSVSVKATELVFIPRLGQVDVQGQVRTPGKIFIQDSIRIDHALARAGGPVYDEANLTALVVYRANGETEHVELSEQFWNALDDADAGNFLADGDVLYVPDAYRVEKIYVLGYVRNSGAQKVRGRVTPMQAIAMAGGFDTNADRSAAYITRKSGETLEIDLKQRQGQRAEVWLYEGDTLEIPKRFEVNWSLILSFISVTSVAVGLFLRN